MKLMPLKCFSSLAGSISCLPPDSKHLENMKYQNCILLDAYQNPPVALDCTESIDLLILQDMQFVDRLAVLLAPYMNSYKIFFDHSDSKFVENHSLYHYCTFLHPKSFRPEVVLDIFQVFRKELKEQKLIIMKFFFSYF